MYIDRLEGLGQPTPLTSAPGGYVTLPSEDEEFRIALNEIRRRQCDVDSLTDIIFFTLHPDLKGTRLDPSKPEHESLIKQWSRIRGKVKRALSLVPTLKIFDRIDTNLKMPTSSLRGLAGYQPEDEADMHILKSQGVGKVVSTSNMDCASRDNPYDTQLFGFEQPTPLPRVTGFRFRNTGTADPDNCCVACPGNLGVSLDRGAGRTASNGMELRFTISGHRPGIEYDIVRTRRNSLWERRTGIWRLLDYMPMGTHDDHHDQDECLRLTNNRIFVIDTPGWNIVLPAPMGTIFACTPPVCETGVGTHADATEVVFRASFAEWVIARSRSEGIPWTPLELPLLRNGKLRKHIYWHSTIWLTRFLANPWLMDFTRSEISLGALSAATLRAAP